LGEKDNGKATKTIINVSLKPAKIQEYYGIQLSVNFQTTLKDTFNKTTQHFSPGYQILMTEYQQ